MSDSCTRVGPHVFGVQTDDVLYWQDVKSENTNIEQYKPANIEQA